MADTAYQISYRQEYIHGYEVKQSLLRDAVTNEAIIKGNQATFLIADSNGATTTTRGINGLIPNRVSSKTQKTATLSEEHDKAIETGFNIFASQGDLKRIMQETSYGVVNRKVDSQIITELDTATNDTGSAVTASMSLVAKSRAILGVNKVPNDGNLCGLITPAFENYLIQLPEFASADYVNGKPMEDGGAAWKDTPMVYRWLGITWIVHPELTGVGTSSEKCYLFHRNAIGHAMDNKGMQTYVDYNKEDDYSYCRTSIYMGAKLLQNSGVVQMVHDGSAFTAS